MGWERRGNGFYYYRKRREGHRGISEYYDTPPKCDADNPVCRQDCLRHVFLRRGASTTPEGCLRAC